MAEGEGAWDLDSVEVGECLEGPDTGCAIERCRHEKMWEVLHLIDMSDVLVVATVRVDKALVCFDLA